MAYSQILSSRNLSSPKYINGGGGHRNEHGNMAGGRQFYAQLRRQTVNDLFAMSLYVFSFCAFPLPLSPPLSVLSLIEIFSRRIDSIAEYHLRNNAVTRAIARVL